SIYLYTLHTTSCALLLALCNFTQVTYTSLCASISLNCYTRSLSNSFPYIYTMDPFNRLPSELRAMILLSLSTRVQVVNASQASPALYQQRKQSRLAIVKPFIRDELPGDLLRDAVAIVTFPKGDGLSRDEEADLASAHLAQWGRKQLPDPFEEHQACALLDIDALVDRLRLFMDDYIDKATSSYLPRAYASLPHWSHPSYSRYLTKPDAKDGVLVRSLRPEERVRLTRAFLRYELTCKMNPLRPSASNRLWRDTLDWAWWELATYEALGTKEGETSGDELENPEALQCVHEYLRTLYGALMARISASTGADIKLPASSCPTEHPDGLLFPDTLQFHPEIYMQDDEPQAIFGVRHSYVDRLAGGGFNLAMAMLTSDMASCSEFLQCFYDEVTIQHPERAPYGCRVDRLSPYIDPGLYHLSTYGSPLCLKMMPSFLANSGDNYLSHAFRRVYRQRAWAFLDDEGLYPKEVSLPTTEDFETSELQLRRRYGMPLTARGRGRGIVDKMRMGVFLSPNRKALKRGVREYPVLAETVKGDLWDRHVVACPRL
ncbi:hypothetical protein EDB81DRAFT_931519, partial [Dactylonectria macrodidyma]